MGIIEEKSRKRSRRVRLENILIGTVAAAGVLGVAMIAPNALRILKGIDPDWLQKRDPNRRVREAVYRLKRKGLVEFKVESGKKRLRLTRAGERAAKSIWSEHFKLKKPARWDRKWRMVIFDIRENRRYLRNKIRKLLKRLGFCHLQHSVWVYPYDCEEVVALLKADLKLGKDVLYIIADAVEFDVSLRRHFNLPMSD